MSIVGDIILQQMKESALPQTEADWFDGGWNSKADKVAELSILDALIVTQLKQSTGRIQIGTAPVYFDFSIDRQHFGVSNVTESLSSNDSVYNINPVFFRAMDSAFQEAPPEHPLINVEKYLRS